MTPASSSTPFAARWPLSVFSSAFIATIVGFGGTIALIVQAGQTLGGTAAQIGSMVTALCLGIAVAGAALSYALRMPIVLAWSTPGAALLAASAAGGAAHYPTALGAFLLAALLMLSLGLIPALGRLAARIPGSIASAMLAGVLLPFCLSLFRALQHEIWLVLPALIVFILARQRCPTYALLLTLLLVIGLVVGRQPAAGVTAGSPFGLLQANMPRFDLQALVSLGLPLFLVTLASQNLPGLAVLRVAGYEAPPRTLLFVTGLTSVLLAPFGAHAVNLAAITAAICTGDEAHPDRKQRWRAGLAYAGCYGLLALFSAPLVALFMSLPADAIATITGLALLAPLGAAFANMLSVPQQREAAVLSCVATASGFSLLGIGAAFWGLLLGFAVLATRRALAPASAGPPPAR